MNYQKHYDALIARARNRVPEGYVEKHHVIPKCMGGGNEKSNLVRLTPEEHCTAHILLTRVFPGEPKLVYAANLMTVLHHGCDRKTKNKAYGWLRRKFVETVGDRHRGKTLTEEHKAAVSRARSGTKLSDEHKAAIGRGGKGRVFSEEHKAKIGAANKGRNTGKTHTAEHKEMMRLLHTGKKMTPEQVEQSAAKRRGAKRSPEFCELMRTHLSHEQRSAAAHKAWETKRANKAQAAQNESTKGN